MIRLALPRPSFWLALVIALFVVAAVDVEASAPCGGVATAKSGLSIRGQANTTSPRVGLAPLGAKITVLRTDGPEATFEGKTAKWFKVRWEKVEGWAFGGFITLDADPATAATSDPAAQPSSGAAEPQAGSGANPAAPVENDDNPIVPPALLGQRVHLYAGGQNVVWSFDLATGKAEKLATIAMSGEGHDGIESLVYAGNNILYCTSGLNVWSVDIATGKTTKLATVADKDNIRLRELAFVKGRKALVGSAYGWDGASIADNFKTWSISLPDGKVTLCAKRPDHEPTRLQNRDGLLQEPVQGFTEVFVTGPDGKKRQVTKIGKLGLARPEGSDTALELLYAFRFGTDRIIVSPIEEWGDYAHGSIYCFDLEGSGSGKPLVDPSGQRVMSSSYGDPLLDVTGNGRWAAYHNAEGKLCLTDFGKFNAGLGVRANVAVFAE